MQLQMRRNVEQVNEAITDLDGWLNEMGRRDATLRGVEQTGGLSAQDDGTDEEEEAREIEAAKEELRRLSAEQDKKDATSETVAAADAGAAASPARSYAELVAQHAARQQEPQDEEPRAD